MEAIQIKIDSMTTYCNTQQDADSIKDIIASAFINLEKLNRAQVNLKEETFSPVFTFGSGTSSLTPINAAMPSAVNAGDQRLGQQDYYLKEKFNNTYTNQMFSNESSRADTNSLKEDSAQKGLEVVHTDQDFTKGKGQGSLSKAYFE